MNYDAAIALAIRHAPKAMNGKVYVVQYPVTKEFDIVRTDGRLAMLLAEESGVRIAAIVDYLEGVIDSRRVQRAISLENVTAQMQDEEAKRIAYESSLLMPLSSGARRPLFIAWQGARERVKGLRAVYGARRVT